MVRNVLRFVLALTLCGALAGVIARAQAGVGFTANCGGRGEPVCGPSDVGWALLNGAA